MFHRYYSPMRPLSLGTYPKPEGNNIIEIHNYDERIRVHDFPRPVWGYIEYDKPLADREMLDYELFERGEYETGNHAAVQEGR